MNINKIKQKIYGIISIIVGFLPIWLDKDITAGLIFIPLGIYLLFTKKQILDFD